MENQKKKITIHDIKTALLDEKFRAILPESLKDDVRKFLQNPGCGCNNPIFVKVMKEAKPQLSEYFPLKAISDPESTKSVVSANDWQVINCTIYDLNEQLKSLGPGRKQIELARYNDQVTVVVNHLEGTY